MSIKWTEDLSTSVDEIDDQHKEIFRKMEELQLACRRGKGRVEIGNAIQFLEDYVTTHFDTEEKYMREYSYPGYASHKEEHTFFIKTIVGLKRQLETEGPGLALVIKTNFETAEWLRKHICRVDMYLGSFLKSRELKRER